MGSASILVSVALTSLPWDDRDRLYRLLVVVLFFFQWQGVYESNSGFLANYQGQESSREGSSMVPRDTSVDGLTLRCRVKERTV